MVNEKAFDEESEMQTRKVIMQWPGMDTGPFVRPGQVLLM